MSSQSPQSWFWISAKDAANISINGTWPYLNVSITQFYDHLVPQLGDANFSARFLRITAPAINAFGVVSALLLIGTLWRKAVVEKSFFHSAMMSIAVTDLVFCMLALSFNTCYFSYRLQGGSTNSLGMWVMLPMRGLLVTVSLFADMLTIGLTFERCTAVLYPQWYKKLKTDYQRIVKPLSFAVMVTISLTRTYYGFILRVEKIGSIYVYVSTDIASSPFMIGLATFSDSILPFILLCTMLILSTTFRIAVMNRLKKKTMARANQVVTESQGVPLNFESTETKQEVNNSSSMSQKSMMILTLSVDALFILNQLGYCFYFAITLLDAMYQISYDSSEEELSSWVFVQQLYTIALIESILGECLSHALNFILYVTLSESTRIEFKEFIKKFVEKSLKIIFKILGR